MVYKIFSIVFSFFILVSPVFAQQDTPVTVEPSKTGSDISLNPLKETTRIGSYETLARLPGLPAVIDPGLEKGDAGAFTLPEYIKVLVRIAIGVIGILAVVMIVISGVQYMGSAMVTEKEGAKQRLTGAVLGLILAVSSVLLLRTINPQLTSLSIGDGKFQGGVDGVAEVINIPDKLKISGGGDYLRSKGEGGKNPNVTKNITTYDAQLKIAAKEFSVSCTVLKAHAYAESGMDPKAVSPAGAQGLIQLMPATFKEANVGSNAFDPQTNARAAAKYIAGLSQNPCPANKASSCVGGSYNRYSTAGYNAGKGANAASADCSGKTKWECEINGAGYKETREYVDRVWANITVLKTNGWGCD
jgi:hypothetical protein